MHRQLAKSRCLPILTIQCLLTYGSFYIQQQHLHGSIISAFYDSTQEEHIIVHSIVDRPTQLATTTSTLLTLHPPRLLRPRPPQIPHPTISISMPSSPAMSANT